MDNFDSPSPEAARSPPENEGDREAASKADDAMRSALEEIVAGEPPDFWPEDKMRSPEKVREALRQSCTSVGMSLEDLSVESSWTKPEDDRGVPTVPPMNTVFWPNTLLHNHRRLPFSPTQKEDGTQERLETLWAMSSSHGISWDELDDLFDAFKEEAQRRTAVFYQNAEPIMAARVKKAREDIREERKEFLEKEGVDLEGKEEKIRNSLLEPPSLVRRRARKYWYGDKTHYCDRFFGIDGRGQLTAFLRARVTEKMIEREGRERAGAGSQETKKSSQRDTAGDSGVSSRGGTAARDHKGVSTSSSSFFETFELDIPQWQREHNYAQPRYFKLIQREDTAEREKSGVTPLDVSLSGVSENPEEGGLEFALEEGNEEGHEETVEAEASGHESGDSSSASSSSSSESEGEDEERRDLEKD
uniref:Uncharacterized protein n=1 Tax=Chromera velia CCMP2878 TaxID=1169474 RepID=A0A0G4FKI4_9ALVE|eukprot:Cvel_3433.t1-p1 / transcript=Cvel_3433.t1 / gene=Cvel_3433 / organism=Chromera_velia_CCMP2878 / gene_product=Flap endonuclease 1, putative / transcript_product=Flap endonuclease 1, putative / location=Cvel_scaffold138:52446-54608(-) / protein_length=417 / sequence_SO=supercontig / SO=protein_coding / is_pseudo=false